MGILLSDRGFTIIEVVLSTLVMGIIFLGNVLLVQNVSVANVNSTYQITASQLANEKLEAIIADNSLQAGQYSYIDAVNYPPETLNYGTQTGFFDRSVSIAEVADDLLSPQAGSKLKKVDVTVTWGSAPHERVVLTTLITDYN